MKKLYYNIVNMSVLDSDPVVLRNKLKVFNVAIAAILLISLFYFGMAVTHAYHLSAFVCAYSVFCCLTMIFLVGKRKHTFAFNLSVWYGITFLTSFSYIFGPVTNSHYYFLFMPVAVLILFDHAKTILIYFILIVLAMMTSVYIMDHFKPYYEVEIQERWLGYPNIPFVMILTFLAVRLFKNENRKYAEKIEQQHAVLEEKNKEITDSINYAKRIQSVLLAPTALLKKHLPEHFIFYKPKDIVSGDFYWADEQQNNFWLCVGDCTGHGVPGAFMSLLNISILRELITEKKIASPDAVLNAQRQQIITALNPDGAEEKGKDGMDCVLMKFDFSKRVIQFSCANNPVIIVRDKQLIEFKPDKQPVGIHEGEMQPFTLHTWEWKPGDCLYLFTDGYADQFGGPKGKKFKYAQLKEKILSGDSQSMKERENQFSTAFEQWKGNLEQVDDVLIVCIKT